MTTTPNPRIVREANRNRPPVDSWIDDAPITDRQLDVLRADLDNRRVAQFNKDVVRKLVHSVELARAAEPLRDEYGIRATYTSTREVEAAIGPGRDEAEARAAQLATRDNVVSAVPLQRKVGEWHELGGDRG